MSVLMWSPWSPCPHDTAFVSLEPLLPKKARVLDIGCGRGETLAYLASHTNWELWGVDPIPEYAQKTVPQATIMQAWAEALPFSDNFFDAVILECVFSLCNTNSAAVEIERILPVSGHLLLTDLYSASSNFNFSESTLFRNILTEDSLLHPLLERRFRLRRRHEYTKEMQLSIAQMIFDGENCALSPEERQILRACRAGYALWELERV